jgi:hypothetical protein
MENGCDMTQAGSRRPLTVEVRVRAPVYVGFVVTKWQWDRFFSALFGFPCQYHSTVALHTYI